MSILVSDMGAAVRVQSGLRLNRLFSNDQIADLLSDAYADFRDKVDARNAFWFKETYPFTLNGTNTLDNLSTLIPDLKEVQYVNRINGTVKTTTVTALGSVAERNDWTSGAFGFAGRRYFVDGDTLEILPPPVANGTYEIVYTPQYETLALPLTRSFELTPVDSPFTAIGNYGFSFANAAFDATRDIGATFTVAFDDPNTAWSGTYKITAVNSPTSVFIEGTLPDPTGFTLPAAGPDVVETYQPVGSRNDLPQSMRPWAQYLITHACIAIRTSRKQDTTELERKLAQLSARVVTATKTRTQGVQQAPITRRRRGNGGSGGRW